MDSINFQPKLESFLADIKNVLKHDEVPAWFKDFALSVDTFALDLGMSLKLLDTRFVELESQLVVQKKITDILDAERHALQLKLNNLEDDLDDQQQRSRRPCILVHGIAEEAKERTDDKVLEVFQKDLNLDVEMADIQRSHRIGKRSNENGRARPIIVRFLSYRKRKLVFDTKKLLKGKKIMISESLTPKRYDLLKKCYDVYGMNNCWTYDGVINCLTGDTNSRNGYPEKKFITKNEDLCEMNNYVV